MYLGINNGRLGRSLNKGDIRASPRSDQWWDPSLADRQRHGQYGACTMSRSMYTPDRPRRELTKGQQMLNIF